MNQRKIFLLQLKHELKELRCNWIKNISSALNGFDLPSNSGFSGWLNRKFQKNKINKNYSQELNSYVEPFYLLKFSLNLESIISASLSESENFNKYTIPLVIFQISELKSTIENKTTLIKEITGNGNASAILKNECNVFLDLLGHSENQEQKKAS